MGFGHNILFCMNIYLERIYNPPIHKGYRVLIDRLWPRGLTRERAQIDEWCKDVTPTSELRRWYHANTTRWPEFEQRYRQELEESQEAALSLLNRAHEKPLILLTATKNLEQTHALILKDFLKTLKPAG